MSNNEERFKDFDLFCIVLMVVLLVSMAFAKWADRQEPVYFEVEHNQDGRRKL